MIEILSKFTDSYLVILILILVFLFGGFILYKVIFSEKNIYPSENNGYQKSENDSSDDKSCK